jgi:hypothetical protein
MTHRANHRRFNICKLSLKYQVQTANKVKDVIIRILTNAKLESAYFSAASIHNGIIKSKIPAGPAIITSCFVIFPSQNIKKFIKNNTTYNIKQTDKNTSLSNLCRVTNFFI